MNNESYLEIKGISKTYPGVKALENVQLQIEKGEVHALVGENGAGKSTLIKILAGVLTPDNDAVISINGHVYKSLTPMLSTSNGISVIFQDFSLFSNLTVAENISLPKSIADRKKVINNKSVIKLAKEALREVGMDIPLDNIVGDLSVAKQQIIAIARALTMKTSLFIMDEPTSTLSSSEVEHLFELIDKLKKKGISILFVSHKLEELFRISDRFTILRDGKYIGTYNADEMDEHKLISLMVGRDLGEINYTPNKRGEPILRIEGLTKEGNFKDISFTLHKGEILGITGLVGSGRTEVISSIFGVTPIDSGKIFIHGKQVVIKSISQAKRHGLAMVPEDRLTMGIIGSKNLIQNTTITILDKVKNRIGLLDFKKEKEYFAEQMASLNIYPKIPELNAANLSGGNQQKIVLAKWLVSESEVLMVDEPTNGIDVGTKSEIHAMLQKLAREGKAIIVVSSELPEILTVSDRILVMRGGRIVAQITNDKDLTQNDILSKALMGNPLKYKAN